MKKLMILLLVLLLSGCSNSWERIFVDMSSTPKTYGVWLSYVDYGDMLKGKSESEFQQNVQTMMANLESLGMNRIYTHVSMFTDSLYESEYYPMSRYVSGKIGKTVDYDPLEIIISEASLRQIQVEAWINPLRSFTKSEMEQVSNKFPVRQWYDDKELRKQNLMLVDNRYYLNPGSQDVKELVNNYVKELCTKYNLAGVHIDDYFYPAGMKDAFDESTYVAYTQEYPEVSVADYRREMTNQLVSSMYQTIKGVNHLMVFSISPSANIDTNYNSYYADVLKWTQENGYCDVMIPQVYFGFENGAMPFKEVVDQWEDLVGNKVRLVYGLAAYKVGEEDAYAKGGKYEWQENVDILSRQIEYVQDKEHFGGIALYRYYSMFYPKTEVKQQMKIELSKVKEVLGE